MYIKSFPLIFYNNISLSLNKKKFKYLQHFKVEPMEVKKLK